MEKLGRTGGNGVLSKLGSKRSLNTILTVCLGVASAAGSELEDLKRSTRENIKKLSDETKMLKVDQEKLKKSIETAGVKMREILINGIKEGRGASLIEVIFRGPKKKDSPAKENYVSVAQIHARIVSLPEGERDSALQAVLKVYASFVEAYVKSQDNGNLPTDEKKISDLVDAVTGIMQAMQIAQSYLDKAIKREDLFASLRSMKADGVDLSVFETMDAPMLVALAEKPQKNKSDSDKPAPKFHAQALEAGPALIPQGSEMKDQKIAVKESPAQESNFDLKPLIALETSTGAGKAEHNMEESIRKLRELAERIKETSQPQNPSVASRMPVAVADGTTAPSEGGMPFDSSASADSLRAPFSSTEEKGEKPSKKPAWVPFAEDLFGKINAEAEEVGREKSFKASKVNIGFGRRYNQEIKKKPRDDEGIGKMLEDWGMAFRMHTEAS